MNDDVCHVYDSNFCFIGIFLLCLRNHPLEILIHKGTYYSCATCATRAYVVSIMHYRIDSPTMVSHPMGWVNTQLHTNSVVHLPRKYWNSKLCFFVHSIGYFSSSHCVLATEDRRHLRKLFYYSINYSKFQGDICLPSQLYDVFPTRNWQQTQLGVATR